MSSPDGLSETVRATLVTAVRRELTPAFVRDAMTPHLAKYRARLLTIEVVTFCLLELVLRGLPSLRALVRRLRLGELVSVAALQVTDGAVYQRLAALPHAAFLALLRQAVRALPAAPAAYGARAALAPFATALVALDDTTLDALARKADAAARVARGTAAALGGRLGCALDLLTGRLCAVAYDSDAGSNERHRFGPLLDGLAAGTLVVFDRGYFAFDLLADVSARFLYYVTRWKDGVSYRVAHTLVATPRYRDELVWLGGGPAATEALAWPVRRVAVAVAPDVWHVYVTNVWDPRVLPADRLVRLYAARWSIERAFAVLKGALGLHTLHAAGLNGLLIQVWCTLLLYQVLDVLRAQVGRALAAPTDEVSWPLLVEAIALYAERPRTTALARWLTDHARDLDLHIRQPGRRVRFAPDRALAAALRTPPTPLPLATLAPQRAKRRPSRARPKPDAYRFLAVIQSPQACNGAN
jgi:hypothetical protein